MKLFNKVNPWAFPITWMIVIFIGSSIHLSPDESVPLVSDKIVHFIEYGILGALFFFAFIRTGERKRYVLFVILSTVSAFAYGVTDEIHQYFVPTREFCVYDLIADFSGGLFFSLLMSYLFRHKCN